MDAQFGDTLAARFAVTEIARLKPFQSGEDAGLRLGVAKGVEPFRKRFAAILRLVPQQVEHEVNVTYTLQ